MPPELFRHQADALRDLIANPGHRVLFWEMGCGKTVVAARLGVTAPGPKLYLCPASCKVQVSREVNRFTPGTHVQVLNGLSAHLDSKADWIVANYELLLSTPVFSQLIGRRWSLLVVDECHLVRSMTAKRTARVLSRTGLATRADRVLALTGTPVVGSPLDLFPLMARLFPESLRRNGRLMTAADFEAAYCEHRTLKIGGRTIEQITGGKNLGELRERLAPYVSRLRRDQVLDLPPLQLIEFALAVETDSVEAATAALPPALLEALRRADDEALPELLRQHAPALAMLRRLLGTLKAPAAAERILEHLEAGADRIVAFFHHRDVGDLMLTQLRQAGVVASMIRGDTQAGARTRAIDGLANDNLQVLLLQTQAGGLGLNLQASRLALMVEPDWTDVATQQAIGRIYRAGQTRACTVEFLFVPDSLDEHVTGVARRKAEIAANLIDVPPATRSMSYEYGSLFPAA